MMGRTILALAMGAGLVVGLALLPGSGGGVARADAGVLYVAPGGQCGAAAPCYASVQAAVDAASAGDEIRVAAGAYTGVSARDGTTQSVYINKTVTVRGGYTTANWTAPDPAVHRSILDAGGQGRVVVVRDAAGVRLDGLNITGGDATGLLGVWLAGSDGGGGLYAVNAVSLTLTHSQVYGNSGRSVIGDYRKGYGGGVYLDMCNGARLEDNAIAANSANSAWSGTGGGLFLFRSHDLTLRNNIIRENVAAGSGNGEGGGLYMDGCDDAFLEANVVAGNIACNGSNGYGGGIDIRAANRGMLDRNRVSGNLASRWSWGWGGGVHLANVFALTLRDNVIIDNTAAANPEASAWGGGIGLERGEVVLVNTVLAGNDALTAGSALSAAGGTVRVLHATVARNRGPGAAIWADLIWGNLYSSLAFTNTIISSHTVGVTAEAGSRVTLDATLWHANTTDRSGAGAIVHTHDYSGHPAFEQDGYHLTGASAAIDRGMISGVIRDIDGHSRPQGAGYDLGADEFRDAALYPYTVFMPLVRSGLSVRVAGEPANTAPQASFTIEPAAGYVGTVFTFDASGSSDAESSTSRLQVLYDWENDGVYDSYWWTAPTPVSYSYKTTGTKTIRLLVKDPEGLTGTTTRTLTVADPGTNTPPTARCVASPATGPVTTTFTFDASGSSDQEDGPAALVARWDWYDTGFWSTDWLPINQPQQWKFDRHGVKTVRLRVRDTGTLSRDTTCVVEVTPDQPNTAPTAAFTVTPTRGDVNTVFTFDAAGSSDLEDTLAWLQVHFDWEDDGIYDSPWWNAGQTLSHRYAAPGRYTVRMEVKDTGNLTATATQAVLVMAAPVYLPFVLYRR